MRQPQTIHRSIDVTAFVCPTTFVKVSLELEDMAPGELLAVRIREGESRRNVLRTVAEEGHSLLSETADGEGVTRLVLRKGTH